MRVRLTRTDGALMVLVGLIATFLGANNMLGRDGADPDMFWHIASGRWIVEHRAIPSTDVLSWWGVANHRPWTPHEWLYDIGAWAAYAAGGFMALLWVSAVLGGIAVVLMYALARVRGLGWLGATITALVAASGVRFWTVQRPQVLTFCLVLTIMLLLERKHWWWALLPVAVVANTHGATWSIILLVYALYAIPEKPIALLAAILATGLNPHPIQTWMFPFLATGPLVRSVNEYLPTAPWTNPWGFALLLGLLVFTRRVRIPWKTTLFTFVVIMLAFSAKRYFVWLYVLALPQLAPYAAEGLRLSVEDFRSWLELRADGATLGSRLAARVAHAMDRVAAISPSDLARTGVAVLLVGALLAAGAAAWSVFVIGYQPLATYPVELAKVMKQRGITQYFNAYGEGGYLIFAGLPPMVDGRWDPFVAHSPADQNLLQDYFSAYYADTDPRPFMDKYKIRWALLPRGDAFVTVVEHDPRFKLDTLTNTHVLFEYLGASADTSKTPTVP